MLEMPEARRYLIVDDSETDRLTLRRYLARGQAHPCTFFEGETVQEGLEILLREKVDCVLLDFMLPDGTALDFIEQARDRDRHLRVPIVIQTGTGSQADAVSLMKAGAHDYLVKGDLGIEALRLAVQNAIYRVETERVIEQQQEELRRSLAEVQAARDAAQQAQAKAEQASAAKDEFLAMISHELRTPLTPVLSIVSAALAEKGITPDLRETFSLINRNIEVEARLIDDLLDLTKVLSGQLVIKREPVELRACWQAAAVLGNSLIETKRLQVEVQLPSAGTKLSGDFARLQQLFWTILKNAAEFTPMGGRIEVTSEPSGDLIRITIRDWGAGIAPERLARIFEVFQRPGGANRFGTLGIGLSIAQAIAQAHGGTLTAQSAGEGQGAAFIVELPLGRTELVPAAQGDSAPPSNPGKFVLVVDDHDDTRRVLARALRRRGYGVGMAANAAEALTEFGRQQVDLVVCDIGLPDGNGWDVIRRVRETSQVKAIAVTGYGMDSDIQRSKEAGFDGHITKPIDFPRLERMIQSLLGGSGDYAG